MRFWMVGCEKPKKSAPDGTMGATALELREGHGERVHNYIKKCLSLKQLKYLSWTYGDKHQNTKPLSLWICAEYPKQTTIPRLCAELWYLTAAIAFSKLEWQVRAEEATMAF